MDLEKKTDLVKGFITSIQNNDSYQNQNDIRSVTNYSLYQISESFLISLILSEQLSDIGYCQQKISPKIESDDLATLEFAFDGFVKDAYFVKFFVSSETHIRQIAEFYESPTNKINVISISTTFKNLMKTSLFTSLTYDDKELFEFYCYLRNTMHNIGFQSKPNQQLIIKDSNSVIEKTKVTLELTLDSAHSMTFSNLILIQEQIYKLLLKINSLIPESDFIEHKLVSIGFNS